MNVFLRRLATDVPCMVDMHLLMLAREDLDLARLTEVWAAEHPELKKRREELKPRCSVTEDGMAVVPVRGTLARNPHVLEMLYLGVEDSCSVHDMVRECARNDGVKGLLLDMDTPGGMATGGPEICDELRECRKRKPVVAHTSGMMASLGYLLGSQADAVMATQSAQVGSIGAIGIHADVSKFLETVGIKLEVFRSEGAKFKAPGAGGTALNDTQREYLQDRINAVGAMFRGYVMEARPQVKEESMRGQLFTGKEAKVAGLVDAIGDRAYALSWLRSEAGKRR